MNTMAAFITYLLPIVGWGYVFLFHRDDKFAVFHTKQSMMLIIAAIVAPIVWAVSGWVIAFIPYAGPLLVISLFGLVLALYITLFVVWIMGMVYALRAQSKSLPLVGPWAERLPFD